MSRIVEFFRQASLRYGVTPFARERVRRIRRIGPISAFSAVSTVDLIQQGGAVMPIKEIRIRATGTLTTNGTSGTATDTSPAMPFGTAIRLEGAHRELGQVKIYDGDGIDAYWIGAFKQKSTPEILGTLATNSNHIMEWVLPLYHPGHQARGVAAYLDPRDYANLNLQIDGGAASTFGYTNDPTAIANLTYDILITEALDAIPQGFPHYVATYPRLREAVTSANAQQRSGGIGGGFVSDVFFRIHDDSQAGDSERQNGLIRTLRAQHRGQYQLDVTPWESLRARTNGRHPLAYTTTRPAGIAIWDVDADDDPDNMIDARAYPIHFDFDSSTTPAADTTAIVPGTGDYVSVVPTTMLPTHSLAAALATMGF